MVQTWNPYRKKRWQYLTFSYSQTVASVTIGAKKPLIPSSKGISIDTLSDHSGKKTFSDNGTKLYAEFWGIFEAKITNNLNLQKLYKLGEKINVYLKELKNLWEKDLKNRKIDFENESIAQLYTMFLKEILWDQKKSELVQKKINEDTVSKMIVFSNSNFITDDTASENSSLRLINLYSNRDLILNSVAYLTDREDEIKIRKNPGMVLYMATNKQDLIVRIIIFLVPIIIIFIGIIIGGIRKRKN